MRQIRSAASTYVGEIVAGTAQTSTTRLISNFPVAKWPRARHFGRRLTASASHPPLCAGISQGATMIRSPSHRTARTGRSNNDSFREMNLPKNIGRHRYCSAFSSTCSCWLLLDFLCALGAHVVFQVIEKLSSRSNPSWVSRKAIVLIFQSFTLPSQWNETRINLTD
jgi:hypothetical protein